MNRHLHFEMPNFTCKLVTLIFLTLFAVADIPAISQPHKVTSPDKRIRRVYTEGDRLIGIAWGWSMADGKPLRPGCEPTKPQLIGASKPNASTRMPKSRYYPYPADYKCLNDPEWKQEALAAEHKFSELISEYIIREGPNGLTVANLQDHLSRLYAYSNDGDSQALDEQVRKVLWPSCPQCHKSDQVSMLSPIPQAYIESQLKHGWWLCQGCSKEFRAKRSVRL